MAKVLVLGGLGMLGRAVGRILAEHSHDVVLSSRGEHQGTLQFEAGPDNIHLLIEKANLQAGDYIVNAIGLITHRIDEAVLSDRSQAISVNALFPHELALAAQGKNLRVIQIATDCVYDGSLGNYSESAKHDAIDLYGRTKSLGEVPASSMMHLRCSIVGPESGRNLSLFEWVRGQEPGATVNGYSNHFWNGLTTHAFGRIVAGLIETDSFRPGVQHLVPWNQVSKAELVSLLAARAGRRDIHVLDVENEQAINRTLATTNKNLNAELWMNAGYETIPRIEDLINEMPIN